MSTQTFNSSGTWTCPTGVLSVNAKIWPGGGGGADGDDDSLGGGGGGGGTFESGDIAVTPGNIYTVTIGAGGAVASDGGNSVFEGLTAHGGIGAIGTVGGDGATGDKFDGGNGQDATGEAGGGGGSSAGTGTDGYDAAGRTGATAPLSGGAGGDGGATEADDGEAGTAPGGGGGGGGVNGVGAAGGKGRIILKWIDDADMTDGTAGHGAANQVVDACRTALITVTSLTQVSGRYPATVGGVACFFVPCDGAAPVVSGVYVGVPTEVVVVANVGKTVYSGQAGAAATAGFTGGLVVVINATWNPTTCVLTKTTATLNFVNGLLKTET